MYRIELVLSSLSLHHFWTPIYLLAKTNSDIELLKTQVTTLSQANADLVNNLKISESVFKYCLTFIGFVIASLAAIFTFLYGKGLKEVRQEINSQVKAEVFRQIKTSISGRISALEEIIDREDIIKKVSIEYLSSPDATKNDIKLLKARGFIKIKVLDENPEKFSPNSDIFIMDLLNSKYTKERKEELVRILGQKIATSCAGETVFVIYVEGHLDEVKKISDNVYFLPANSKSTLVGTVVNAANTSCAIKGII
jgi:hypothetical protein